MPIYLPCLLHDSFVHFHNTLSNLLIYSFLILFAFLYADKIINEKVFTRTITSSLIGPVGAYKVLCVVMIA